MLDWIRIPYGNSSVDITFVVIGALLIVGALLARAYYNRKELERYEHDRHAAAGRPERSVEPTTPRRAGRPASSEDRGEQFRSKDVSGQPAAVAVRGIGCPSPCCTSTRLR
jgi:hypothetical protein